MGLLFTGIYSFFRKHLWAFVLFLALVMGFEVWFGSRIILEEDINKVIPASEKNNKLVSVLEHAKFADRLVICITQNKSAEIADPEVLSAYAKSLIDSLQGFEAEVYVDTIEGRFTPASFSGIYNLLFENLPLFLDEDDYKTIDEKLGDSAIALAIKKDYEALISPGGFVMKDFILKDPLSFTPIALKKLEGLKVSENFDLYDDYIVSKDSDYVIIF